MRVVSNRTFRLRGLGTIAQASSAISIATCPPADVPGSAECWMRLRSGGAAADPAALERCRCLAETAVAYAQDQGIPVDAAQAQSIAIACAGNPEMMAQTVDQLPFKYADRCRPVYMKRSVWIGGGVVAALGAAYLLLR